jgi:hypothetical protein
MLALAGQLTSQAWASDQAHTAYLEPSDESAGPGHPRALLQHSAKKAIAYDQIPAHAPVRRLYESDDLTGFIAAVLGLPALYRSADPLDALEIAVFGDGDELGWHFDNSEPGHAGQRTTPADQLGAHLRTAPGHEADRGHPKALLRPNRLTRQARTPGIPADQQATLPAGQAAAVRPTAVPTRRKNAVPGKYRLLSDAVKITIAGPVKERLELGARVKQDRPVRVL